jgi:hypothetical protein
MVTGSRFWVEAFGGAKLDSWLVHAKRVCGLSGKLGFGKGSLEFLGYVVDLDSGSVYDKVKRRHLNEPESLYLLLDHYSEAKPADRAGRLVVFRDLPGGYAYERAFVERAIRPVGEIVAGKTEAFVEVAEVLGGVKKQYGDISVEIPALPRVPLTYVMWRGDEELQSSANVLFDVSAGSYLPTEDLAVLGELTTKRLIDASEHKKKRV